MSNDKAINRMNNANLSQKSRLFEDKKILICFSYYKEIITTLITTEAKKDDKKKKRSRYHQEGHN